MGLLKIIHKDDGWWITGADEDADCGPYATKREAEEDKPGLERFWNDDSLL